MLIRAAKRTLGVAVVAAVLVIVAFGAFRVLLARLPAYEGELAAWIDERFGVRLDFAELDARWGIEGPELTLRRASVTVPDQAAPFLSAREVRVGVSPFALVARLVSQRELAIEHLTFEGTQLAVLRTAAGELRVNGAPNASAHEIRFDFAVPPNVDVRIRDSELEYIDAARAARWDFTDVAATLRRDGDTLVLEGSAAPPAALAQRISLDAQGVIARDGSIDTRAQWHALVDVADVDLGIASQLFDPLELGPIRGTGDVAVQLAWAAGALASGTLRVALADVTLARGPSSAAPAPATATAAASAPAANSGAATGADPNAGGRAAAPPPFERIALTAEWQALRDGWRAVVNELALERGGRAWPAGAGAELMLTESASERRFELASPFLRLEDLAPFAALAPRGALVDAWRALAPSGDARDVALAITSGRDGVDYAGAARFEALGLRAYRNLPALDGLTGEVRADSRSGRLVLEAGAATVAAPEVLREPVRVSGLAGTLVWREGQDALRIVGDDLVAATADFTTRTSLELTLPHDGSTPIVDLETDVPSFEVAAVTRYLPAGKMPARVVAWLDGALRGGRASGARVTLFGPLAAFPFDAGEGELRVVVRVEDGVLAFVEDWPAAEALDGTVEFVNTSFVARGSGRVLGNRTADVQVGIEDLRRAVLAVDGETIGPLSEVLAFLNGAPQIARFLGPDFARLEAPGGTGAVAVDLRLPLFDLDAYELDAALEITDGELAYAGFGPRATEIHGTIELADGRIGGDALEAIFLEGPVTVNVAPADAAGYRTHVALEGEVAVDAVTSAFELPFADLLNGQTRWRGDLLIPNPAARAQSPARITVESNLSGIASRFPAPFAKAPGEAANLQVAFAFPAEGGLEIDGHWGAARRFALQFDAARLRRAALRFGGALPALDFPSGVRIDGSLPVLALDEWLTLIEREREREPAPAQAGPAFAGAALDVEEFSVFGQALGATRLDVRRRSSDWQVDVDSMPVAGTVLVPADLGADPQIVAVMRRLYLRGGGGSGGGANGSDGSGGGGEGGEGRGLSGVDPRELPGLQLHAEEFALGTRHLGRLDAEVLADEQGLRLVSFASASPSFTASGSGAWLASDAGSTSRMAVTLASSDVAATLDALGFDPIIEAESAQITANVFWPGAPSGDWLAHVGGDVALRADEGSLIDVEPGGAGRMAGLLSFSALPRRLALDFRDVFARGFVFDEISADFVVVDGNAYTDNLKLTGPTAEIGIVGRTGLRDRDYRQQAVVTAEPGKMLPTVGGLIGGPGVAAALLIFTRIFKEPLKGIGRASYCVTGRWHEPEVERLTDEQVEAGEVCAELAPGAAATAN